MDIEVNYNHGKSYLCIHLEYFLEQRNMPKFKQLLRAIEQSDNWDDIPECKRQIKKYIEYFNSVQYPKDKNGMQAIIAVYEAELNDLQVNSEGYLINKKRLSATKTALKKVQRELANTEREKIFLEKCLKLLQ